MVGRPKWLREKVVTLCVQTLSEFESRCLPKRKVNLWFILLNRGGEHWKRFLLAAPSGGIMSDADKVNAARERAELREANRVQAQRHQQMRQRTKQIN